VTLAERARMITTSNQGYTGLTTVQDAASLTLDYSGVGVTNIIPGALRMAGGNILLKGGSSSLTDSVSSSTLASGNMIISGQPTGIKLGLGSMTRQAGGVLEIRGAGVTTANPVELVDLGILGGYATFGTSLDSSAEGNSITTWAVPNGINNAITGLPPTSYLQQTHLNDAEIPDDISSSVNFNASKSFKLNVDVGSLRFNTAPASGEITVLLSGGTGDIIRINSGGLLVTKNVGANDIRITDEDGGIGLAGGTGEVVANELIIHQHNTRGSLTLNAPISDDPDVVTNPNLSFTKTGQGRVILTQTNTYTGLTNIFAGVLQLGDGGSLGSLGTPVNGLTTITNNGYLALMHGSGTQNAINDLAGTGSVQVDGGATQTLGGSNSSYTGTTYVLGGKLRATQSKSLGSTDGLTSVAPQATLEIGGSGLTSSEAIYLRGGILSGIGTGAVLNGAIKLGSDSTVNSIPGNVTRLSGPVLVGAGAALTLGGSGTLVFNNVNNQFGSLTAEAGSNLTIQIGGDPAAAGAAGSVGRALIKTVSVNDASATRGKVVVNVNDAHFILGSLISGTGGLTVNRSTIYLTADNTYSGPTLIGGNGLPVTGIVGTTVDASAELRVGNDTYTGRFGTDPVTIQSSTAGQTNVRFQTLRNVTVNNTIRINPWNSAPGTVRNTVLVRHGLGSLNLAGTIIAGDHDGSGRDPKTQRAFLQTDFGGKLTVSGTIDNGADHRLNFQPVNNSIIEFAGSTSNALWGRLLGNNTDNTTAVYNFNTTGTTTLKGYNNFANTGGTNRLNNVYIQRGTLQVDHDYASDPDTANATQVPDGINDDADIYLLRGAAMRFNQNETTGFFATQKGSDIQVPGGVKLVIDDSAAHVINGGFSGDGTVHFNAVGGGAWYGLFGPSTLTASPLIGSATQITTVRVSDLIDASGLGTASTINLGISSILGTAPQEVRLEYVNRNPLQHLTNKDFNLTNSGSLEVKLSSAVAADGALSITLDDVGSLAVNMAVSGPGIAPGTLISAINAGANTVTHSGWHSFTILIDL
jgi:autotransporter-associated beta strand protein